MGLCTRIRNVRSARCRSVSLDPPLQLAQTLLRAKVETANQLVKIETEQPIKALQLEHAGFDLFLKTDKMQFLTKAMKSGVLN